MVFRRLAISSASLLILGLFGVFGINSAIAAPNDAVASSLDSLKGGEKVHALIDAVVEQQRSLEGLSSRFVLLKSSDLLLEPIESRGSFSFMAPDRVRWDYSSPEPMVVVFADDTMTTFQPEQSRAEMVKISGRQRKFVRILAGAQPLDQLTSQFSVALSDPGAPANYRLTMRPTHSVLKKKFRSVVIEVDRTLLLPVVVEYHEVDGDSTRYEFLDLKLNPVLADSIFALELGEDVAIELVDVSAIASD
ncbi:MAG: outer membrane lipoprotein carrier protein LolA [bacterium]|nr:outer membrane lipoprotein carrier protein LolA [bacterium]